MRKYVTLAVRVGSGGESGREPVWARWPMKMHRPLPEHGVIKRAAVFLRKIGPREEWCVTITVDDTLVAPRTISEERQHFAVGVDLGWRVMEDGVRIARWYGQDGVEGGLTLPSRIISQIQKADELRSVRDKNFNIARATLIADLAGMQDKPEWLRKEATHLYQWRSIQRLAGLTLYWSRNRFEGDRLVFEPLNLWREHDEHLWAWESSQRLKGLRHRRDYYRCAAARLANQYGTVVLEQFDLSKMARLAPVEAAEGENQNARSIRQVVSPGEFRQSLTQAVLARNGTVATVPAPNTTRACHVCKHIEIWDQAAELTHTCSSCGAVWDQDDNAGRNILEAHLSPKEPEKNETVRAKATQRGGKWASRKNKVADAAE